MTQPTEADIRAACEEAGVRYQLYLDAVDGSEARGLIRALARRIAAEREAVPVSAVRGEQCKLCGTFAPKAFGASCPRPECEYRAHPTKEPTNAR